MRYQPGSGNDKRYCPITYRQKRHNHGMSDTNSRAVTPQTHHIPLTAIKRDRNQARRRFDETALGELADSIGRIGLVQPVVVQPSGGQDYRLIAGERRWRAAQRAGLSSIPAIVRADLDDSEAAAFGLIENLQRESLGVMETAHGLAQLNGEFGLTHDVIAARIGKSRAFVTNFLRLTQLAGDVQGWIEDGYLSLGHAKILAGLERAGQIELGRLAIRKAWSVRRLESAARQSSGHSHPGYKTSELSDLSDMEKKLSARLGNQTRVLYQSKTGRGELRIQFHSLEEFDGLLRRLGCNYE